MIGIWQYYGDIVVLMVPKLWKVDQTQGGLKLFPETSRGYVFMICGSFNKNVGLAEEREKKIYVYIIIFGTLFFAKILKTDKNFNE